MDNNHYVPNPESAEESNEEPRTPIDAFLYHQRRALEETSKALDALVPPGFKEHSAEAGREFVKGFRVLVDAAITELEKLNKEMEKNREGGDDRPSTTGPNKVKVQVE